MKKSILFPCQGFTATLFALAACGSLHAQTTTVAYDGFNYTSGAALAGQNGGTGWTSAWVKDYSSGATFDVSGTGLTYPGLTTSGGSIVWTSGGNGISEDSRTLLLQDSGVVYIQFIGQFTEGANGGTPNLRLYDSGTLTGGIGANGATTVSILGSTLEPNGTTSTSNVALSGTNFIIARIDYSNDDTEMWVNPNLSTFNYADPTATPDATYNGLAPAFNDIAIYARDNANIDEIQVLTIPEPGAGGLLAVGAGMALWGWWRRGSLAARHLQKII